MSLQNVYRFRGTYSRNTFNHALQYSEKSESLTSDSLDIGLFVERHRRLTELLFPFKVTWNACFYIIRWENYPLTLGVAFLLSVFLYYPSLLLSLLTLLTIVAMAMGKYYSTTKRVSILKIREQPNIDLLDQDYQTMQHIEKEQNESHLLLLEYKEIIQSVDRYFLTLIKFSNLIHRIILWKSSEVSLCVTVLFCVCFVLLCTVSLRVTASCTPVLVLCCNRYFINRTVELWRKTGPFVNGLKGKWRTQSARITPNENSRHENKPAVEEQIKAEPLANSQWVEVEYEPAEEGPEAATPLASHLNSESVCPNSIAPLPKDSPKSTRTHNTMLRCTKCGTLFSLIKRKHDCAHCGHLFCASCTTKVKRSFLGATAPAAFEGSVRVCEECRKSVIMVQEEVRRLEEERRSKRKEERARREEERLNGEKKGKETDKAKQSLGKT